MKFIVAVILIILLSAVGEHYMPWWIIALVCFVVSLFAGMRPGRAFLAGFAGIGLFWLEAALVHDIANEHILSQKMAVLFHLPNYGLFITVTVFVGALVGGLAAWSAALLRRPTSPSSLR